MPETAILFDLDGTLLDTLSDIADAMNRALTRRGRPARPVPFYKKAVGDGMEMLARRCLNDPSSDQEEVHALLADYKQDYLNNLSVHTRIYPGVTDLLKALQARGIRTAVYSNKPHALTVRLIEDFFTDIPFEYVIGAREGLARKPDPAGAVEVARHMNLQPGAFYYLGDTDTDMKTASAAGMTAVGVLWGFREADELRKHGARHLISDPMELTALLDKGVYSDSPQTAS